MLTSANRRGAETQGLNVARSLTARGLATRVVALSPSSTEATLNVEVLGGSALGLSTLRRLRRLTREHSTVVAFGSRALPAAVLALIGRRRTRLVYRSIGNPRDWSRGRLHRWRTALLFRRVDEIAALWAEAGRAMVALYGVDERRVHVIPNWRSEADFRPPSTSERDSSRQRFGLSTRGRVVAFVGALSEEKRPDLALRALSELPDTTLLIAGDGPLRSEVEAQASALDPSRVVLLGAVDDVLSVYHAADAVVLTSRTEGMPGVLIEAGLCGLPCVTTAVGAAAEVVQDGDSGCVVAVDASPHEIAQALDHALRNAQDMGARGQAVCREGFSEIATARLWLDLLDGGRVSD